MFLPTWVHGQPAALDLAITSPQRQAAAYAAKPKKFSIKGNRELGILRDEVQVEMHS